MKCLKTPKALNMNNPVQAAKGGAARGKAMQRVNSVLRRSTTQSKQILNSYGVPMLMAIFLTPSCGYRLARGYSHFTPSACCQDLKK